MCLRAYLCAYCLLGGLACARVLACIHLAVVKGCSRVDDKAGLAATLTDHLKGAVDVVGCLRVEGDVGRACRVLRESAAAAAAAAAMACAPPKPRLTRSKRAALLPAPRLLATSPIPVTPWRTYVHVRASRVLDGSKI